MNSIQRNCPYCGRQHSTDAQFCPETGQRLEHDGNHCPSCGEELPEESSFCPNCGYAWLASIPAERLQQQPWLSSSQTDEILYEDTASEKQSDVMARVAGKPFLRIVGFSAGALVILAFSYWAWSAWDAAHYHQPVENVIQPTAAKETFQPIQTPMVTELTQNNPSLELPSPTFQPPTLTPSLILPTASINRRIIFSYGESEGERSIYFLDVDGGETWQVASFSGGMNFPAPAPGGEQVIFSSRTGTNYDDWDLYLYNLTSGDTQQLANRGVFPDWCREASKPWIVYEIRNGETSTIWFMNLDDRQPRQLTRDGKEYRPKWSPDCSLIVFSKNYETQYGDLYIYDLASEISHPLVVSEYDESVPIWSPDGQWISFSRRDEDTNNDQVLNANDLGKMYIIHPDGSGEHQLEGIRVSPFSPSWSPDSRQIVFSAQSDLGGMQILRYSLEDDQVYPLTEPGAYYHPRWVP